MLKIVLDGGIIEKFLPSNNNIVDFQKIDECD